MAANPVAAPASVENPRLLGPFVAQFEEEANSLAAGFPAHLSDGHTIVGTTNEQIERQ